MKFRFFLLFLFIGLVIFSAPQGVNAQNGEVECPAPPRCPPPWTEYQCTSVCNANIQTRTNWYVLSSSPGDPCPSYFCEVVYGQWNTIQTCLDWQECQPQGIQRTPPKCSCASGQCLSVPENPRYYDDPNHSNQPEKSKDPNNIFLPVKLDWDDVPEWQAEPDGAQSYRINIQNTRNGFPKTTAESEFIPSSCVLKSGVTHPWQVSACCTLDGQNCGPGSNWSFNTSLAPEPVSP